MPSYPFAERVMPLQAEGAYAVLARATALEAQSRDIIHLKAEPVRSALSHLK